MMEKLKSFIVSNINDLCNFQNNAGNFGEFYIPLIGKKGLMNYFYFSISGHFAHCLCKYKNLYKFFDKLGASK